MKKVVVFILSLLILFWSFPLGYVFWNTPDFNQDLWQDIEDEVYNLGIDESQDLDDNILNLFSPYREDAQLWEIIRYIWVGIFIAFIVRAGARMLIKSWDESELQKSKMNLVYILFWGFLFFGVTWILWTALDLRNLQWADDLVDDFQENLMFEILSFLKAAAFFAAIVMLVYYWYKIIQAFEKEDKIAEWRKWALNVVIALVFIKIVDFVFYIAQSDDFRSEAQDLMIDIAQVLWYILGILLLLSVFYAGFLLLTSRGDEEYWKKAKNVLKIVFLVAILIMLFLLIVYQVITELT